MSSTEQNTSRVEFLTLDMERLTFDQGDDLPKEEGQDAVSENLVDIIVEHRYPGKKGGKWPNAASEEIQNAARNAAKNWTQYGSEANEIGDYNPPSKRLKSKQQSKKNL